MKAIKTHYLGPTNYKGARIVATADGWGKVEISYPYEFSNEKAHFQAVLALIDKVNRRIDDDMAIAGKSPAEAADRHLEPPTVYGGLPDCYVWCYPFSIIEDEDSAKARIRNALEAKDKLIKWHQAYEADLQRVIEAKDQRIADLEAENERLRAVYETVIGWREYDWPEGFDRRTAELIAVHVRDKYQPAKPQEQSDAG